jgi:hypothetical protein
VEDRREEGLVGLTTEGATVVGDDGTRNLRELVRQRERMIETRMKLVKERRERNLSKKDTRPWSPQNSTSRCIEGEMNTIWIIGG